MGCDMVRTVLPDVSVTLDHVDMLLDTDWLLDLVTRGGVVMVPYDCAANSSVCMERGHKAHWGVITGILLPTKSKPHNENCSKMEGFNGYYQLSSVQIEDTSKEIVEDQVKVVVRQSKTLELEFYNRSKLVQSNRNLEDIAGKRLDGSYVIPDEGINHTLNS